MKYKVNNPQALKSALRHATELKLVMSHIEKDDPHLIQSLSNEGPLYLCYDNGDENYYLRDNLEMLLRDLKIVLTNMEDNK